MHDGGLQSGRSAVTRTAEEFDDLALRPAQPLGLTSFPNLLEVPDADRGRHELKVVHSLRHTGISV
jgi:hypothetical protein